jgi:heptosyltransferase-2
VSAPIDSPRLPPTAVRSPASQGALIIRLRNWVGDVLLMIPTLLRLQEAGHELHLIGKGFAPTLLRGMGWSPLRLEATTRGRIRQLRELRQSLQRQGHAVHALVFPYSLSSALEMRLAGLRAVGFAGEGRSLLLGRALPRPQGLHVVQEYALLADALLGSRAPSTRQIDWRSAPEDLARADARLAQLFSPGESPRFIVACPYTSGSFEGQSKDWPHFLDWLAGASARTGRRVLVFPGPGEAQKVPLQSLPGVHAIEGVDLAELGAIMRRADLVVANDTGPGHLAAAAGARLLSILGPTPPERWGALGPKVHLLRCWPAWPTLAQAQAEVDRLLAITDSAPQAPDPNSL